MLTKTKGEKPKGRSMKKVEKALACPNPVEALDYADWQFAMHLAMGKSNCAAARLAYPGWSEATVISSSCAYANRADIVRAKQHLLEVIANSKQDAVIASKLEAAALLTSAIRTPLSEIDREHPLCIEHTKTINSNGASEKIKKVDPIDAIRELGKLMGWTTEDGGKPRVQMDVKILIQQASSQGVPIEVTEVGEKLLEGID